MPAPGAAVGPSTAVVSGGAPALLREGGEKAESFQVG